MGASPSVEPLHRAGASTRPVHGFLTCVCAFFSPLPTWIPSHRFHLKYYKWNGTNTEHWSTKEVISNNLMRATLFMIKAKKVTPLIEQGRWWNADHGVLNMQNIEVGTSPVVFHFCHCCSIGTITFIAIKSNASSSVWSCQEIIHLAPAKGIYIPALSIELNTLHSPSMLTWTEHHTTLAFLPVAKQKYITSPLFLKV